jgi:hypothetical protein
MKILKIKHGSSGKGNKDFTYSHYFLVRIKSGLLSYTDARILVYTNRQEISIDEVINAIESQEKSIMREILYTLCTQNEAIAVFAGIKSFTAKIGDDDCRFFFSKYKATDYAISNPANW